MPVVLMDLSFTGRSDIQCFQAVTGGSDIWATVVQIKGSATLLTFLISIRSRADSSFPSLLADVRQADLI